MPTRARRLCFAIGFIAVSSGAPSVVLSLYGESPGSTVAAAAEPGRGKDAREGDASRLSHWAWRKPVRPSIPIVHDLAWPRNPIDNFVLARLEQEGIKPAPEVDRYTLIRRLSLDLIGLPPSPDEVQAFVNDTRPDAFDRLVDRLLADPGYGERWARMWLDLARYADSKGYGSDPLRTIWRYRDWVINAFNNNVPYDQFTIEQLAGDLLPNPTHDQLLATAFHRNTMANDEGGTDDEQFRVEAVKDRVDSTMQIWMGITMGCAKCHSHKFDPITQREYYEFFAFFNQTEDADRGDEEPRIRSPSPEQRHRLEDFQRQTVALKAQLDSPPRELVERLAAGQAQWEAEAPGTHQAWVTMQPTRFVASNGTELRKLDDHSVLAEGKSPETDKYSIDVVTEVRGITAIRMEVLPHPSLPGAGPGRAGGNFVLNDLTVTASRRDLEPLQGRYVRVEIPGVQRILSLAEVQVFGVVPTGSSEFSQTGGDPQRGDAENLARGGKATQSSTDYDGPAHLAIDGNTNGHYFEARSTTHTRAGDNPWWEVDLGSLRAIGTIVIWNRSDGGLGTRLTNFRVAVLGEDRKLVWEKNVAEAPTPRAQLALGKNAAAITLQNATADYEQSDFPVSKAIDRDAGARSGWAIGSQFGKPHVAVFELSEPITGDGSTTFTITLNQTYGSSHTIGRLRFSATAQEKPPRALPPDILDILGIESPNRTADQVAELARYYRSIAPELRPLREQIAKVEQQSKELEKQVPLIPVLRELTSEKRRPTHVLVKSNFQVKGEAVEPSVPSAFHPLLIPDRILQENGETSDQVEAEDAAEPGDFPTRLDLARWLVSPDSPLTARVAVNRLWSQIYGRGLVETEEDFGTQGLPPSHPELLDWLATEFMDPSHAGSSKWDVKSMLRLIVTSATYRQSSTPSPEVIERDPDNRLLSRGPRHRLEAEMVRDQALALAGLLSRNLGGASVYPPQPPGLWRAAFNGERTWPTSTGGDRYRRGLYTFWRRTVPYPSMATFDAPSREICTVRRVHTNTPLQAFVTLNDPVFVEAAQALARRIVSDGGSSVAERAQFGLRLCLCRPPHNAQVRELVTLYESELAYYRSDRAAAQQLATDPLGSLPDGMDAAELAAWTVVSNVLLNLDGILAKR